MACAVRPRPPLARQGYGASSDRHDAMARMRERRNQRGSEAFEVDRGSGDSTPRRARPPSCPRRQVEAGEDMDLDTPSAKPSMPSMPPPGGMARASAEASVAASRSVGRASAEPSMATARGTARGLSETMPTPRGGARGPAEARAAREVADDTLPKGAMGADFKTLQAMIAKGIQENEEDGALFEASVGGADWGRREELEEAQWRQGYMKKRHSEEAAREKERERAREQRRRQDEERRRRQMEQIEKELMEEKRREGRLDDQQKRVKQLCQREFDAAKQIQARFRGRRSRLGHPIDSPNKQTRWELHEQPLMPAKS